MEFKNFTLNCFKVPSSDEYIGMFKIKWLNGINTRVEWTVFCDDNTAQEGVSYNSNMSSNVHFSANLDMNKNYCVVFAEYDAFNTQLARTWGFVKGSEIESTTNECVLADIKNTDFDNQGFTFGSRSGLLNTPDWNFGNWNFEGFGSNEFNFSTPSGWIYPTQPTQTPQINAAIPAIADRAFNELPAPQLLKVSGTVEVDSNNKSCEETLDELIKQLECMEIKVQNRDEPEKTVETDDREEWEIELDKIIDELDSSFSRKKFSHTAPDKLVLVENYLGEKLVDQICTNEIPMPPPLPASLRSFNYTDTKSFKDELRIVRNRVMGRENDIIKPIPKKRGWFSLFR
jgi:hypothetical protein